jgi:hypothetical protein
VSRYRKSINKAHIGACNGAPLGTAAVSDSEIKKGNIHIRIVKTQPFTSRHIPGRVEYADAMFCNGGTDMARGGCRSPVRRGARTQSAAAAEHVRRCSRETDA